MPGRGNVRHQAAFQSPATGANWTTEFTRRVALVPLDGSERLNFAVDETEIVWSVSVPYVGGIKQTWRILLSPGGRVLQIKAWKLFRHRRKWLQITCTERIRDGVTT